MKLITKMSKTKKIAIVILSVLIFTFLMSSYSAAKDSSFGGKLLQPIGDFLMFCSDGIMNVLHGAITGQEETIITVDKVSGLQKLLTIFLAIQLALTVAALIVITAGVALGVLAAVGVATAGIGIGTFAVAGGAFLVVGVTFYNSQVLPDRLSFPMYSISPQEIFENKIPLLDVNFFNPKEYTVDEDSYQSIIDKNSDEFQTQEDREKLKESLRKTSTAKQLQSTISSWYKALRLLALVGMLSVLVYIGIRIVISSTASDKAKYKEMITDWVVAVCLLFLMQYIMSFSMTIVDKITDMITTSSADNQYAIAIDDENGNYKKHMKKELEDIGFSQEQIDNIIVDDAGKTKIIWNTNLMGYLRMAAQMGRDGSATYMGYVLMFVVLTLFTVFFIFTYLKRVLLLSFLTMIAPLVALTYPIDKINDGKAQGFNAWFKEYIFNLLIQPLHLALYTILVSSAAELATENVIYSMVAIGFILPSEKLLRNFFGFGKASTPSNLAGSVGAGMALAGIAKSFLPKGKGKGGGNGKDENDSDKPIETNHLWNPNNKIDPNGLLGNGDDSATSKNERDPGPLPTGPNAGGSNNYGYDYGDDYDPMTGYRGTHTMALGDDSNIIDVPYREVPYDEDENTGGYSGVNPAQTPTPTPTPTPMPTPSSASKPSRFKGKAKAMSRGAAAMASGIASQTGRNLKRQAIKGVKKLPRTVARAGLGAGGAIVGAAVGGTGAVLKAMATGELDPKDLVAGAGGGFAAGYGLGGKLMPSGKPVSNDVLTEAREAYYGDDKAYEEAMRRKQQKEYKKNEEHIRQMEAAFGREKAKKYMKENVDEITSYGVTDIKDVISVLDLKEKENMSQEEAILAVKDYNMMGKTKTTKMKAKDREDWAKTMKKQYDREVGENVIEERMKRANKVADSKIKMAM